MRQLSIISHDSTTVKNEKGMDDSPEPPAETIIEPKGNKTEICQQIKKTDLKEEHKADKNVEQHSTNTINIISKNNYSHSTNTIQINFVTYNNNNNDNDNTVSNNSNHLNRYIDKNDH